VISSSRLRAWLSHRSFATYSLHSSHIVAFTTLKVLYWHQCFHEESLTSTEDPCFHSGKSVCRLFKCSSH